MSAIQVVIIVTYAIYFNMCIPKKNLIKKVFRSVSHEWSIRIITNSAHYYVLTIYANFWHESTMSQKIMSNCKAEILKYQKRVCTESVDGEGGKSKEWTNKKINLN